MLPPTPPPPAVPSGPPVAIDPVTLAQLLIRCPSVTPTDAGVMEEVAAAARLAGFDVHVFEAEHAGQKIKNLVARRGQGSPSLAFVGHVDVVPPGPLAAWSQPPFAANLVDGRLYGRGAVDMKGDLAAFLSAAAATPQARGTLQLLITGDEEQGSPAGMRAIMAYIQQHQQVPEVGLIGEASCEGSFGQGIRIGRRGSLHAEIRAYGILGHVAWPQRARNALHLLVDYLHQVQDLPLAPAESVFPASSLQVTQVVCDNRTGNVIPGEALARLNIRFNPGDSGAQLKARLEALAQKISPHLEVQIRISGEPYLSGAPKLVEALLGGIAATLGKVPEQNAGGGTSDGRFLHALCPVVEFGLVGDLAHQVDESVPLSELLQLRDVYAATLRQFFGLRT
jgi:succinyl-diaminopimelate desuccinylase